MNSETLENLKIVLIILLLFVVQLVVLIFTFNQIYKDRFTDYYVLGVHSGEEDGYSMGYESGRHTQKQIDDNRLYQNYIFCEVDE